MDWHRKAMAQVLYHGTSSSKAAEEILASGIRPGDLEGRKNWLTPVPGRVYLTPSLKYAVIYALGGVMMGHDVPAEWFVKEGPSGYVFEVPAGDLQDAQPDEDSVGEAVYEKKFAWLNYLAERVVAPSRLEKVYGGEYIYFASVGKQLMRHLSDGQKRVLMDAGANVAHKGAIKPIRAWKFDKRKSKQLAGDASNFFELAERVL